MIDSKTSDKNLIAETLLYYNKTAVLELSRGNYPKAWSYSVRAILSKMNWPCTSKKRRAW